MLHDQIMRQPATPDIITKMATTEPRGDTDFRLRCFALAKAHDDAGDYDQAWKYLQQGNAAVRDEPYDIANTNKLIDGIIAGFPRELIKTKPGVPTKAPIFILGMPRTGSTLIEQILISHPKVETIGETDRFRDAQLALPSYAFPERMAELAPQVYRKIGRRYRKGMPNAARVVDKMPRNRYFAGLIHMALPKAKIIHTMRDPRDMAISAYSVWFRDGQRWSNDIEEIGRYYNAYARLMKHWRDTVPMMEIRYEDLIDQPHRHTRRILKYCGLSWDERCARFWETKRTIDTASKHQVTQPIYSTSVGRWQNYEKHLGPLVEVLDAELD